MTLARPEPLSDRHHLLRFNSGVTSLDDWLKRRALKNQLSGASRTYVACDGDVVVGYYALAAGGVAVAMASGRFRRNMPEPIPVIVLGRLAVDQNHQRRGLGRALFRDAAMRALQAADTIGARGVIVHAISDEAKAFYIGLGLEPSPIEPMTLMVTLDDLRAAVST